MIPSLMTHEDNEVICQMDGVICAAVVVVVFCSFGCFFLSEFNMHDACRRNFSIKNR